MDPEELKPARSKLFRSRDFRYRWLLLGIVALSVLLMLSPSGSDKSSKSSQPISLAVASPQPTETRRVDVVDDRQTASVAESQGSPPRLFDRVDIRLQGVVEHRSKKLALLSINRESPLLAAENEMINPGIQLAAIQPDHIVIRHLAEFEKIALAPEPKQGSLPALLASRSEAFGNKDESEKLHRADNGLLQKSELPEGVERVADYQYLVARDYLDQVINSPNFLRQALVDSVEGGGFVFNAINPGGPFDHLGFRMGDFVSEVNGKAINTVKDALTIGADIDAVPSYEVKLIRDDKPVWLRYYIH